MDIRRIQQIGSLNQALEPTSIEEFSKVPTLQLRKSRLSANRYLYRMTGPWRSPRMISDRLPLPQCLSHVSTASLPGVTDYLSKSVLSKLY